MKRSIFFTLLFLPLLFTSCFKDSCTETRNYIVYDPVFRSMTELNELKVMGPQEVSKPGKMYIYGKYLLINDYHKGIHVYDNSNPSNPINLAFYPILGNVDLSVKNNMLYADNFLHLLTINITDPVNPVLTHVEKDVFKSKYFQEFGYIDSIQNLITVEYVPRAVSEKVNCEDGGFFPSHFQKGETLFVDASFDSNSSGSGSVSIIGIGGSTARFTIIDNALYSVLPGELNSFDISDVSRPTFVVSTPLAWNAETVFPFKGRLLIGTRNGLLIYNVTDNPLQPKAEGAFGHVSSCDPVVASGDVAYVTLWSGSDCGPGNSDQLDVLNISNMNNPSLIASFSMKSPRGLAIMDNYLFVCEAEHGVKLMDASDPAKVGNRLLASFPNINAQDVIAINKERLFFIGKQGIQQFSMDDSHKLTLLSTIK